MILNRFSIRDLENLSGIKAHTIRIWEQRYNLFTPQRTDTNIRYYSSQDLKRLLNVSLLNNKGLKISKIVELGEDELSQAVEKAMAERYAEEDHIHQLVISMVELDEDKFQETLTYCLTQKGFINTMGTVIYPFLEKIGVMWMTGAINPAQEHFISNLIRQKIITSIDGIKTPLLPDHKRVLLFLPEGELHEFSLLFYYYLVKSQGHKGIYLGQSVPYDDLKRIYEVVKPQVIISSIIHPLPIATQEFMHNLHSDFPEARLMLSGYQLRVEPLKLPPSVFVPSSINEAVEWISNL